MSETKDIKQSNVEPAGLYGRKLLTTHHGHIDRENVVQVLKSVINDHHFNSAQIARLFNIYRGRQAINEKVKVFRPEINNRVVENHAFEIVNFKNGYAFGNPIQYIVKGSDSGDISLDSEEGPSDATKKLSLGVTQFNDWMAAEDKGSVDKEIAECFHICGTGYRGIQLNDRYVKGGDESPISIASLDPKSTFVVYSTSFGARPVMGVQVVKLVDTDTGDIKSVERYCVWTANEYFEIENDAILSAKSHGLGGIPVIEYPANSARLGAFEPVIGIMDALNQLTSDRLDGVTQHVQSIIKFINCELEDKDVESLSQLGAIMLKAIEPSMQPDMDIVTAELNQDQVQTLVEYLYQTMLTICGMPDRQGSNRTTGDTGQAVILRDGWGAAEAMARETELTWGKSERLFLKIALPVCRDLGGLNIRISDLAIKFTRNRTDNLLVKTQGLVNLLKSGINPRAAIAAIDLFNDPNQVYEDSIPTLVNPNQMENGITKTQINSHMDVT